MKKLNSLDVQYFDNQFLSRSPPSIINFDVPRLPPIEHHSQSINDLTDNSINSNHTKVAFSSSTSLPNMNEASLSKRHSIRLRGMQTPLKMNLVPVIRPLNLSEKLTTSRSNKLQVGKYMLDSQRMSKLTSRTARGQRTYDLNCKDLLFVRNLGSGNSGSVKLMKHKETGCLFAVKSIVSVEDNKELEKEVETAEFHQHPNLVHTINAFVKDNVVNIVQEYVDVGNLLEINQMYKPLPEWVIRGIAMQILQGLTFLHSSSLKPSNTNGPTPRTSRHYGYLHRDLKPENILINSKGEVKIGDFGLVALRNTAGRSSFVGSSMYMSPERIRGNTYTDKSDIWSYGLTILELFTGVPTFEEENKSFIDLMVAVTSFDIEEVFQNKGTLFETCKDHLRKCLQINPDHRQSASELLTHEWITEQIVTMDMIANWLKKDSPNE